MTEPQRIDQWLADLARDLRNAAELADRGKEDFESDPALPLAFEALSNRVGDLAKKLTAADPARFDEAVWSQASRNRDFVVHHYHRLESELLWRTVTVEFPKLAAIVRRQLG